MKTTPSTLRTMRARRAVIGTLAAAALTLTGCVESGSGGGGSSGGGSSVPVGASKEDYIAALADIDEVTISMQLPTTPGDNSSLPQEAFARQLEEWSGGKIKQEIIYASAVAPVPEMIAAVGDGRLDMSNLNYIYEPRRYPAHNTWMEASLPIHNSPLIGMLQGTAALAEVSASTPEIQAEMAGVGAYIYLPAIPTDIPTLNCTEKRSTLAELRGAQTRVAGEVHGRQARALGMVPISLAWTETYEGLQRGTVDCAILSLRVGSLGGLMPLAKHVTVAPEASFAVTPVPIGINIDVWEGLPLAAQQLFYDLQRDYLIDAAHALLQETKGALDVVAENGGQVHEFTPDAVAALRDENRQIHDDLSKNGAGVNDSASFVEEMTTTMDRWYRTLTDELGYEDVSYADFADWYDREKVDLGPWADKVMSEALGERRPG